MFVFRIVHVRCLLMADTKIRFQNQAFFLYVVRKKNLKMLVLKGRFIFVVLQKQVYCHHTVQFEMLFLKSKTQSKKRKTTQANILLIILRSLDILPKHYCFPSSFKKMF